MRLLRKRLKNGMTVIMEKRDIPVASLCIANKFGAIYEDSRMKGVAHFIEHLLFTGTKTRTHEDISSEIERKGGILNAFTHHEVTSFWFKLPSEHINVGMDILVDMLNNSVMNEEKFEREKKVILEEIKMNHDSPARHVLDMLETNLYEKPFGGLVIGNKESVSAMNRDEVFEMYKKAYAPSNFVAVIVGNADFEDICSRLEEAFNKRDIKEKPLAVKKRNVNSTEEREGIDQAHLAFGMHAPDPLSDDYAALEVLNAYLALGMSSKLFLEIREKRGLAYSVTGWVDAEKSYSYYTIYVGTRKDAVDEVKKLIIDGLKKAEKISKEDVEKAKQMLIGLRRVSSEESSEVMNRLLYEEVRSGKAEKYYDFEKRIAAVKLADVRRMAKIGKYSFAAIVPK